MRTENIEVELRAVNPIAHRDLAALDLSAGEAALGEALLAEWGPASEHPLPESRGARGPRRSLLVLAATAAVTVVVAVSLLTGGGGAEPPTRAYGAELVRFAESTPLLLLEGPGWRVENVDEFTGGEGTMEFVRGEPASPEAQISREDVKRRVIPSSVHYERQRRVELNWSNASLSQGLKFFYGPVDRVKGRKFTTRIPTLDSKIYIDTRAETSPKYGGPGEREMVAMWREDGHLLELSTRVPDLAGFRERLGWLHHVNNQTWLAAMPAKVIKVADRSAAVHEMLKGIPLPPRFDPTTIINQHLTTDRYQVGVAVGGGVACEWFRQWGKARRSGNAALAQEAERALASAGRWPVFQAMSKEGAYPATVVEYAKAMPSGRWYGRPLLPDVNQGLGCTELGFPIDSGGG